jgi:uncharacterized membrane protein
MTTPASIAKHPIHPMLVVLPMGLWIFSLVAVLFFAAGCGDRWKDVALYTMGGGIAGALIAAIPASSISFAKQPRAPATMRGGGFRHENQA